MLKNIKIAFIDLDGTLIDDNRILSKNNIEALKKLRNNNIKIVFNSGRWDNFLLNFDKDLNLVDYIISNNGSCIIDVKTKEVIFEEKLSNEQINLLNEYCTNNNLEIIYNGLFKQFKIDQKIDKPIYQSIIICNSKDSVTKLVEFIDNIDSLKIDYISSAYYKDIVVPSYSVNVNSSSINKGNSIEILLNKLNIPKINSICFGDNYNDLAMFENCGIKIAMKNALQEVKDKADYVTLSNNEDGVAYFINKYL